MSLPSHVVELSYGATGFVDVSQYVKSVSINRGITRALDDFSAGSVSITFVNNSRIFDPLNTSSPLWYVTGGYTIVQPGAKVRFSSNGVRRFTGFVQDWGFTYDQAGLDGQATLSALDQLFKVGQTVLTDEPNFVRPKLVESTGTRIETALNYSGNSNPLILQSGQTLLGFDAYNVGDNVLTYLQNVARSEPADLYANAGGTIVFEDRSFTDYLWADTTRQNFVTFPNGSVTVYGLQDTGYFSGWTLGTALGTAVAALYGGTANRAGTAIADVPSDSFVGFEYSDFDPIRYASSTAYVFSAWIKGFSGSIDATFTLLNANGGGLTSTFSTGSSSSTANWNNVLGTVTSNSAIGGVQLSVGITSASYATTTLFGSGWLIESGTVAGDYFDGSWNTSVGDYATRYEVAWAGTPYASMSGKVTSTASTVASTLRTFADLNSQGTAYGNGTAIAFTDLTVVYGGEQLYNQIQIVGVNATAVASGSTALTGLRGYSQTDNLTTSLTAPQRIASTLLPEFSEAEYRAEQIVVALEALTGAQQNIVLGLDVRHVVRLCFQPSAIGDVVDKFYQVLGVSSDTDVERDHVSLRLASLDNLPAHFDSTLLPILLDTVTVI